MSRTIEHDIADEMWGVLASIADRRTARSGRHVAVVDVIGEAIAEAVRREQRAHRKPETPLAVLTRELRTARRAGYRTPGIHSRRTA